MRCRYKDVAQLQRAISSIENYSRTQEADASAAISMAKRMLSTHYNRRDDIPAAIIIVSDDPANTNNEYLVCLHYKD